ncbi:hypothetical protein C8J56DRAFT_1026997 [Mycena floridula]|nr:hypothetical protein C8J56DRAFT_1026997 [Mycena floridula]
MILRVLCGLFYVGLVVPLSLSTPSSNAIAGQTMTVTWSRVSSDPLDLLFGTAPWDSPALTTQIGITLSSGDSPSGQVPITLSTPGQFYIGIISNSQPGDMSDKITVVAATPSTTARPSTTTRNDSPTTNPAKSTPITTRQQDTSTPSTPATTPKTAGQTVSDQPQGTAVSTSIPASSTTSSNGPVSNFSVVTLINGPTSAANNSTPTASSSSPSDPANTVHKSSKTPIIVGCSVAAVILVLFLALGVIFLRNRRRKTTVSPYYSDSPPLDSEMTSITASQQTTIPQFPPEKQGSSSGSGSIPGERHAMLIASSSTSQLTSSSTSRERRHRHRESAASRAPSHGSGLTSRSEISAEVLRLRNEVALLREQQRERVLESTETQPPSYYHVLRQDDGLTS